MFNGNSTTNLASPRPQYPHPLAESSKMQTAQQRRTELHTPFRAASMATPFSDITSDSSDMSLASEPDDGRYSRNRERTLVPAALDLDLENAGSSSTGSSSAWVQWRAEQGRAAHIARGEAATSRANPYAGPALVVRAHAPWAVAGVRVNHGWARMFRTASVTSDAQVRRRFAEDIVATGAWEEGTGEVLALAGMLVERAAEGDAQGFVSVAPFARNLYDSFKRKSEGLGAEFLGQLKRCVCEEFEAWWQPVCFVLLRALHCY